MHFIFKKKKKILCLGNSRVFPQNEATEHWLEMQREIGILYPCPELEAALQSMMLD